MTRSRFATPSGREGAARVPVKDDARHSSRPSRHSRVPGDARVHRHRGRGRRRRGRGDYHRKRLLGRLERDQEIRAYRARERGTREAVRIRRRGRVRGRGLPRAGVVPSRDVDARRRPRRRDLTEDGVRGLQALGRRRRRTAVGR